MALTCFQSGILRLLAENRRMNSGSYVAGGLALNHSLHEPRQSRDFVYLLSAACGKDPGFSPSSMLEYVARRHYAQVEIDEKISPRGVYDAADLNRFWHEEVNHAREAVLLFPCDKVGTCVLDKDGNPFKGDPLQLSAAMAAGDVVFHEGRICGAWPQIVG